MDSHKVVYNKARSGDETTRHRQGNKTHCVDLSLQRHSLDQAGGRETTVAKPKDALYAIFPPRPLTVCALLSTSQGAIRNCGHLCRHSQGTEFRRSRKVNHVPGPLCRRLHAPDSQDCTPRYQPSNILLTATECVRLIEFGTAWKQDGDKHTAMRDLWPEQLHNMYFEVSTGFTVRTTFMRDEQDDIGTFIDPDSESDVEVFPVPPEPFIMTKSVRTTDPTARWTRDSLFEGERGEIMLASGIFKVRGFPNDTNWPSFMQLSDAGKLLFFETDAVDLASLLPHLPPSLLPQCILRM